MSSAQQVSMSDTKAAPPYPTDIVNSVVEACLAEVTTPEHGPVILGHWSPMVRSEGQEQGSDVMDPELQALMCSEKLDPIAHKCRTITKPEDVVLPETPMGPDGASPPWQAGGCMCCEVLPRLRPGSVTQQQANVHMWVQELITTLGSTSSKRFGNVMMGLYTHLLHCMQRQDNTMFASQLTCAEIAAVTLYIVSTMEQQYPLCYDACLSTVQGMMDLSNPAQVHARFATTLGWALIRMAPYTIQSTAKSGPPTALHTLYNGNSTVELIEANINNRVALFVSKGIDHDQRGIDHDQRGGEGGQQVVSEAVVRECLVHYMLACSPTGPCPFISTHLSTYLTGTRAQTVFDFCPISFDRMFGLGVSSTMVRARFRELVLAVGHLHRNGIAHRDIKPANIAFASDGTTRLLDLGSAGSRGPLHHSTLPVCTASTRPPEIVSLMQRQRIKGQEGQSCNNRDYNAYALDSWGLGMVLWSMSMQGKRPFLSTKDDLDKLDVHILQFATDYKLRHRHKYMFKPITIQTLGHDGMNMLYAFLNPDPNARMLPLDALQTHPYLQQ